VSETTGAVAHPEAILVAMDFSPPAQRALDLALNWLAGSEITVLHVVDADFATRVDAEGLAVKPAALAKLRSQAEHAMAALADEKRGVHFDTMIVEGSPFVEIVKLARDLEVDAIVMGMHSADRRIGELLAGSTAEMVLRASHCPVLCVP
jgi:nucleotide-binding universal stress UspA family protein